MAEISRDRNIASGEQGRERSMVSAAVPHAGIARALRGSFGSLAKLPDDWARLLERLR